MAALARGVLGWALFLVWLPFRLGGLVLLFLAILWGLLLVGSLAEPTLLLVAFLLAPAAAIVAGWSYVAATRLRPKR